MSIIRSRALALAGAAAVLVAAVMDEGIVVEEGTREHFFLDPTHERTKSFLSKIL